MDHVPTREQCDSPLEAVRESKLPCYLRRRHAKQVRRTRPNLVELFLDRFLGESRGFTFEHGDVRLTFRFPHFSFEECPRALVIALPPTDGSGEYTYRTIENRDLFWKASETSFAQNYSFAGPDVLMAYPSVPKGSDKGLWERAETAVVVQKCVTFILLNGLADPNCVHIFGKGEGGRGAYCIASRLPSVFANVYAIDARVSECVTPQLINATLYLGLSAAYRETGEGSGERQRFEASLARNKPYESYPFRSHIDESASDAPTRDVARAFSRGERRMYPQVLAYRNAHREKRASVCWLRTVSEAPQPDDSFRAHRVGENKFDIRCTPGLKLWLLGNETLLEFGREVRVTLNGQELTFRDLKKAKDAVQVETSLAEFGDVYLMFCVALPLVAA